MGNAQAHAAPQLRMVAALSGATALPLDAPEWQQLLTYTSPLSRLHPGEVEREIRPHCAELGARWLQKWVAHASCPGMRSAGPSPAVEIFRYRRHASILPAALPTFSPANSQLSNNAAAVYNNAQTLNLQRFIYLVTRQLRRVRRQVCHATSSPNPCSLRALEAFPLRPTGYPAGQQLRQLPALLHLCRGWPPA